ncbi:phage virion morphogenesis protein [Chromobacterium violaceum]|uniref:phage virion morphogenesis protein n=1 Tax=Chromobacterium violaceum TaxID=536 RepID=UPI001E4CEE82|nr:phage virion morphogenesis protein [Chromobacterium violaceum]MCD0491399.1 phage virion morphogenesis protein [Chromobacterium violaceum]
MIDIKIDNSGVAQVLKRLEKATKNRASVMQAVAGIMADAVEENFAREGRPAWQGLKPGSWLARAGALTKTGQVSSARFDKKVRGAKILQSSGRLASSITQTSSNEGAAVGTNVRYAAIHQFGGRTKPHEIRPHNKKALAWTSAGHPVRKVNHPGSEIPARPFLALEDEDEREIIETVEAYLRSSLGG